MAPLADQDSLLLFLQGQVATLRCQHESLVERERLLRANKYTASADALKEMKEKVFKELEAAKKKLAAHISRKQRGFKE
jgi:hypothetical protein